MAFAAGSLMSLRLWAAIMATLQFVLSAILAVALWVEVSKWSLNVGTRITGTSAAAATYYSILSLSACAGSVAIYTREKGILRYFAFCLGWSLGIQIAVSALQLWGYLSTPRSMLLSQCVLVPGMDEASCNRAFSLSIGWLITSIVIGLLVQLCSAYVVSSYSSKLSNEDKFTEKAPLPTISAPQPVNSASAPAPPPPAFASLSDNKEWAAASRVSVDSSSNDDEDDDNGERLDPGPPAVPILDPAPPKRIPRVPPAYPVGLGPTSRDSEIVANKDMPPNPFTDDAAKAATQPLPLSADSSNVSSAAETRSQNLNPFRDGGAIV